MCFDIGVVTCGPNEALVISGVFYGSRPCIIVGGRAIVCPCIQQVQRLPLGTMTLKIESPRVYTIQGVPISVTGVAQVWIIRRLIKIAALIVLLEKKSFLFPCYTQQWRLTVFDQTFVAANHSWANTQRSMLDNGMCSCYRSKLTARMMKC